MHLDANGIDTLVKNYEKDSKAIKEGLFRLCWFMRGSLSITEAYMLSRDDQLILAEIIEGNLNTTKETQMPFF